MDGETTTATHSTHTHTHALGHSRHRVLHVVDEATSAEGTHTALARTGTSGGIEVDAQRPRVGGVDLGKRHVHAGDSHRARKRGRRQGAVRAVRRHHDDSAAVNAQRHADVRRKQARRRVNHGRCPWITRRQAIGLACSRTSGGSAAGAGEIVHTLHSIHDWHTGNATTTTGAHGAHSDDTTPGHTTPHHTTPHHAHVRCSPPHERVRPGKPQVHTQQLRPPHSPSNTWAGSRALPEFERTTSRILPDEVGLCHTCIEVPGINTDSMSATATWAVTKSRVRAIARSFAPALFNQVTTASRDACGDATSSVTSSKDRYLPYLQAWPCNVSERQTQYPGVAAN